MNRLAALGILALSAACGTDRGPISGNWEAVVDTLGDTITVRTLSGSVWSEAELVPEMRIGTLDGEDHEMFGDIWGLAVHPSGDIYLHDRLVPAIRRYASDGAFLGTIGRRGGGPGEYENSDIGGLTVLADGRLLLRDPGNGRFTVYSPDGGQSESWPGLSGAFTSMPVIPSPEGGFLHHPSVPFASTTFVIRYDSGGNPIDTIPVPLPEVEIPMLTSQREGAPFASRPVPFSPTAVWAVNQDGGVVTAETGRYAIDRRGPDGSVLRVIRDAEPVSISAAERNAARDGATEAMRSIDPSWQWSGPPVPSRKPFFRQLHAGTDGRLWVLLHQPGEPVPDEEGASGQPRFQERIVFDVFEPDGRYLGQVEAPEGFSLTPRPIFGPGHAWAVVRDDLDVPQVARFRLVTRA